MGRFDRESHGFPLFLEIAIGVSLGILVSALVIWRVAEWRAERIASEVTRALQEATGQISERQKQQTEAQRRQKAEQQLTAANAQREAEEAKRVAREAQEMREQAWARFYRKPPACDESRGGAWTVDCANDYIRAKRSFDDRYNAGKL